MSIRRYGHTIEDSHGMLYVVGRCLREQDHSRLDTVSDSTGKSEDDFGMDKAIIRLILLADLPERHDDLYQPGSSALMEGKSKVFVSLIH